MEGGSPPAAPQASLGAQSTAGASPAAQPFWKRHRTMLVLAVSLLLVVLALVLFLALQSPRASGTIVATVNGVPIYQEEIDATLAIMPQPNGPPEQQQLILQQRRSVLNQTIDLRLLTQEARRRGITVTDATIEDRIKTVLEDAGRSPPELRLILASNNITVQQFNMYIEDTLLVEQLGQQAVLSRVSVSEQEISAYYQSNQAEFLPASSGVRTSHILVANESTAREVIAALNRGDSFRDLAKRYSLDADSSSIGGVIGVIFPSDDIDPTFRNAALALRENQYTRTPIQTGAGYHVILRNPDIPSIEEVRDRIQTTILRRKQAAAFAAFLEGLRSGADVRLYTADGIVSVPRRAPDSIEAFAACIGTKATLYVTARNDAVDRQLALFGPATPLLTIVDCDLDETRCVADSVRKFPTWAIDDDVIGESTLAELSKQTSCPLPVQK